MRRSPTLASAPGLFESGEPRDYLKSRVDAAITAIERVPEDDFLAESVDSLVGRFTEEAQCGTAILDSNEWVDGDVQETSIDVTGDPRYGGAPWDNRVMARATRVVAAFRWSGNRDLFLYSPSTRLMVRMIGDLRCDTLVVSYEQPGDPSPEAARQGIGQVVGRIAQMLGHANADVEQHNRTVEAGVRAAVEARRARLFRKRDLRGALRFPISRREGAPRAVPVERRTVGSQRREGKPKAGRTYRDEWELDEADYEDIVAVLTGMLRAFERPIRGHAEG